MAAPIGPIVGLLTKAIEQAERNGMGGDPMQLVSKLGDGMMGNAGAAPANADGGSAEKAHAAGSGDQALKTGLDIAKKVAGKGKGKGGGGGGGGGKGK
jgi:hypothetical protein